MTDLRNFRPISEEKCDGCGEQKWPTRFGTEVLMEFDKPIARLIKCDDRVFVVIDEGHPIDITELLGKPKH